MPLAARREETEVPRAIHGWEAHRDSDKDQITTANLMLHQTNGTCRRFRWRYTATKRPIAAADTLISSPKQSNKYKWS